MAKKSPSHSEAIRKRVEFCLSKGEEMRQKDKIDVAILYLNKAKELNDNLGDPILKAMILESFSFCNSQSGKYEEAINKAKKAISIFKKLPRETGQLGHGNGLVHLGSIMCELGKYDEAHGYFEEGIKILSKTKEERFLGVAYGNMGEGLKKLGQFKQSIELSEKALVISKKTKDKFEEARNLINIAEAYYALIDFENAISYCEKSARIFEEIGNENGVATSYHLLGNIYKQVGEMSDGIRHIEHCIKIKRKLNNFTDLAIAYGNMALVHNRIAFRKLVKLDNKGVKESSEQCIHFFKMAVESADKILADLKDDRNLTGFSDRFYRWYNCLSTPFILSGRSKAALLFLDLGRAKILRQLVYKQLNDQGDDGKSNLETSWATIENDKEDERLSSLVQEIKMSESSATLLFYNFNDADILTIWVLDANGHVHLKTSDPTANYSTMHEELEDRITKFLDKVSSLRLPRGYSFLKPFTAINSHDGYVSEFTSQAGKDTSQYDTKTKVKERKHEVRAPARVDQAEKSSVDLTKESRLCLHRALIEPVEDLIKGTKLIIVPERCLFFVPFSSFADENGDLLSEKYQIQIIPSVHVLSSSMRTGTRKPIGGALFVGNPKVDHVEMPPLPSAEEEVKYLASLLDAKPLLGHIATKSKAMDLMSDASIIHFAAHGEDGTGHIFLAPEPNNQSPYSLLTQSDVLECNLSARLVVLSCCSSGHGKISSEGVLGIGRSFLGAGASSVLVTLWKINDKFTQEFMKVFYEKICEEKSACLALKEAMNKFQKSPSYDSFLFWAAFEILGADISFTKSEIEEIRKKNKQ